MSKRIQKKIDQVVERRKYWRELSNGLGVAGGSVVVKGLSSRIEAQARAINEDLKVIDPSDSIGIAKAQAGYAVCQKILLDFNLDRCNERINDLDKEMTGLNAELKKQVAVKNAVDMTGFSNLGQKK